MPDSQDLFARPLEMIRNHIVSAVKSTYPDLSLNASVLDRIVINMAPVHLQDQFQLSSNFAMICASPLRRKPQEVAQETLPIIKNSPYFETVASSANGFVNMRMSNGFWHEIVTKILHMKEHYGLTDLGQQKLINVEYVSANPTGPLHIGHTRSIVYGDIVANLLSQNGFNVVREYYINDYGEQVKTLLKTAWFRYKQALKDDFSENVPAGCYPGDYMIDVGRNLASKYGDTLLSLTEHIVLKRIREPVLQMMLDVIHSELGKMNVHHDVFSSETDIMNGADMEQTWQKLLDSNMIYEGALEQPKGKEVESYQARIQPLFRSTAYGDDIDRPLKKDDGSFTYFMADIAYHHNKYQRGFKDMIVVLGEDHKGYAKRISAAVAAISDNKAKIKVILCEMVNFMQNGKNVKMSKRAGNFLTVSDLLQEIDPDIVRFIMLTRKNNTILDFDLQEVKKQSADNPVFYVQYAHSRCHSILKKAEETFGSNINMQELIAGKDVTLQVQHLQHKSHLDLIIKLASYPNIMSTAVHNYEPHLLVFYVIELCTMFHALWNAGQRDPALRFVIADNIELTKAHLLLVIALKNTIAAVLGILGIKPLDTM